jgi:hypothetical protein
MSESAGSQSAWWVTSQPGCGAVNWQFTGYPSKVTVTAEPGQGDVTDVNMTTYPAGVIRGRITDAQTGHGLRAVVEALPQTTSARPVTGFADSDGIYRMGGVAAAANVIRVSLVSGYLDDYVHRRPNGPSATPVSVGIGQTVTVNESPPRANEITGKVVDKLTGAPVQGVRVHVRQLTGQWVGLATELTATKPVTTKTDGTYTLPNLGVGNFAICFTDPRRVHAARCFRDRAFDWQHATPVGVFGFGNIVTGINQDLPVQRPA